MRIYIHEKSYRKWLILFELSKNQIIPEVVIEGEDDIAVIVDSTDAEVEIIVVFVAVSTLAVSNIKE